ncbi:LPS assembly lipoprotein LptE [Marinovum sp. 2_MG-2023]|uniref:LPS assembly lipoprotein LptE n=1 Tax=unclassified Marinovum TaxID=2647166 RepID=UPI0026E2B022|nr:MULTISPECIES: LPS assembly lipoprotein LptE [unclassified Marinovum]MDO6730207.1 LPS assembly lipoprotein LptE [Marinovum sp. 2_MG-2023]MDO6778945.1 LPS assembly lipoprotein LptE [Marinovum sp. 1_MG-2023]
MWLSDRRGFLCGALALSGAAVSGCGFAPAYGTDGAASKLQNAIHVDEINTHNGYLMTRRIEERLGAGGANAPFTLGLTIGTSQDNLGTTPDGNLTRYQILGRVDFTLRRAGEKTGFQYGTVRNFTGYSASGSTVATLAAERDAEDRLMTMLADQVIERLVLISPDISL